MNAGSILGGAPAWVWILLAGLIALGVRRLRTREVPLAVALIPGIAFLVWSILGAMDFARWTGPVPALAALVGGLLIGIASTRVVPEPATARLADGRVRQAGSPLPLILYLAVFVVRFACGAWAAIRPAEAELATAIGITVGAAVTGRLLSGPATVLRRPTALQVQ